MISCFSTALISAFRFLLIHSVICSLGGQLSQGSPVVVFFDRGHPRFWNFYSTLPVDVFRVKSYMNCLFDPARIVIRVTINKLYFVPEWLVSGVVGIVWNGESWKLSHTGFLVNVAWCTSERLEDLCKTELRSTIETSDSPLPRPPPFQIYSSIAQQVRRSLSSVY